MTSGRTAILVALVVLGAIVGLAVALAGSALLGVITGLVCLAMALVAIRTVQRMSVPTDPSRRRRPRQDHPPRDPPGPTADPGGDGP